MTSQPPLISFGRPFVLSVPAAARSFLVFLRRHTRTEFARSSYEIRILLHSQYIHEYKFPTKFARNSQESAKIRLHACCLLLVACYRCCLVVVVVVLLGASAASTTCYSHPVPFAFQERTSSWPFCVWWCGSSTKRPTRSACSRSWRSWTPYPPLCSVAWCGRLPPPAFVLPARSLTRRSPCTHPGPARTPLRASLGDRFLGGDWGGGGTRKRSEAGCGRPEDGGVRTAKTVKRPPQQPAQPQYANYWAPLTRNDTSRSTGRSGRQKAATRRNMRREERVTVQGLVKKQQPDGMSHGGGGAGGRSVDAPPPPLLRFVS